MRMILGPKIKYNMNLVHKPLYEEILEKLTWNTISLKSSPP